MKKARHIVQLVLWAVVLCGLIPKDMAAGEEASLWVQAPSKQPLYHAVEKGETLYSISRRYGVSVDDILSLNTSLSRDKISAGMIIQIPQRTKSSSSADRQVVREESQPREYKVPSAPAAETKTAYKAQQPPMSGLKTYVVPVGQTVYSLCKLTGWSEEQLLFYNPQIKDGLKAGETILVPQETVVDASPLAPIVVDKDTPREVYPSMLPTMPHLKVVLALPFSSDSGSRFSDYYEGFLLALKETQDAGNSVDLYVYDCSPKLLKSTIQEIELLSSVDYIIGGVADDAISALATVAEAKGAAYVIPFTSKAYRLDEVKSTNVFQVNTPHELMNEIAARKFVKEYSDHHVCLVRGQEDSGQKEGFVSALKKQMSRAGITYDELNVGSMLITKGDIQRISQAHPYTVVVPTSSSLVSATGVLAPISHAVDSLGVGNVTVFGYPEWQTYHAISPQLAKVNATFYTPFYADTKGSGYKGFQKDFVLWFSHSIGNTYPKYSVLGYDTGRYFLSKRPRGTYGEAERQGVQSQFDFRVEGLASFRYYNHGVIFVQHRSDGSVDGR